MGSNNANFENKTASYFSSKMGLFETSRIIAVQDKQTIAKSIGNSTKHRDEHYRAKKKKKRRKLGVVLNESPLEESQS